MSRVVEILSKQIEGAEALLQRVVSIPAGNPSPLVAGFIRYDKSITQSITLDTDSWETETVELLRVLYGEDSRQVNDFRLNINNKNHHFDFKEGIQVDLKHHIAFLRALIRVDGLKIQQTLQEKTTNKCPMVFISHSSKDKEFVEALVTLLEGIGFTSNTLFCSSVPDYWIGLSQNIFDSLRVLFQDHELFVVFVQSPRYYESAVSLNEMGAAWVLKTDCCSILTKDMSREQMRGVVDGSTIFIKVDTEEAPARMNELRKMLTERFNLNDLTETSWERKRNSFLRAVNSIEYSIDTEERIKGALPVNEEFVKLQVVKLKQEAIEKKQAKIRGNIIHSHNRGNRILKVFNSGQATARDVNVEWMNPDDGVIVKWEFGLIGEISPQNGRSYSIALCEGHNDTMRLRYSWADDYQDNNVFEEDLQL